MFESILYAPADFFLLYGAFLDTISGSSFQVGFGIATLASGVLVSLATKFHAKIFPQRGILRLRLAVVGKNTEGESILGSFNQDNQSFEAVTSVDLLSSSLEDEKEALTRSNPGCIDVSEEEDMTYFYTSKFRIVEVEITACMMKRGRRYRCGVLKCGSPDEGIGFSSVKSIKILDEFVSLKDVSSMSVTDGDDLIRAYYLI
mmetsp:Transcript_19519/g.25283  ORF Transcript_19519/g.25283 Transcript_19519/m.25283 type:complete len:202 (-) Transcript_19519:72-677(-)